MTPDAPQPAEEIVKAALENSAKIDALRKQRHDASDALKEETYRLKWDVYAPKIHALQEECDQAVRELEAKSSSL